MKFIDGERASWRVVGDARPSRVPQPHRNPPWSPSSAQRPSAQHESPYVDALKRQTLGAEVEDETRDNMKPGPTSASPESPCPPPRTGDFFIQSADFFRMLELYPYQTRESLMASQMSTPISVAPVPLPADGSSANPVPRRGGSTRQMSQLCLAVPPPFMGTAGRLASLARLVGA